MNRIDLLKKIKAKGSYEQEKQYLFPALYSNKAVTRNTRGEFSQFDRNLKQGKYQPA